MTWLAFALILVSAFLHSLWNALAKRADDSVGFLWVQQAVTTALCVPLAAASLLVGPWPLLGVAIALASGLVQSVYVALLGLAYDRADLSLVYPLVRATAACLVAAAAVCFLGESVSRLGFWAVALVTLGVFLIQTPWRFKSAQHLKDPFRHLGLGVLLAVLIAFIAAYQLIDKVGVAQLNPVAYICWASLGTQIGLTVYVLAAGRWAAACREWSRSSRLAAWGALAGLASYLLVLWALTLAQVSYLAPMRNLSMVFAVFLGATALRERLAWWRLPGVLVLLAGVMLLRWA